MVRIVYELRNDTSQNFESVVETSGLVKALRTVTTDCPVLPLVKLCHEAAKVIEQLDAEKAARKKADA